MAVSILTPDEVAMWFESHIESFEYHQILRAASRWPIDNTHSPSTTLAEPKGAYLAEVQPIYEMVARKDLRLVSLDGGGTRSISQLEIMQTIMYRLRFETYPDEPDRVMLPCEHFDMIGGSDTGGLIAIMLAKLRMSIDEATEEFYTISKLVYNDAAIAPAERSARLRACMEDLMKRKALPIDLKLTDATDGICACFVLATPRTSMGDTVRLRTYPVRTEPPSVITVIDAVLATCASPVAFAPVAIGARHKKQEYVGPVVHNPFRDVITEAHLFFGGDSSVTSILSLGCGHPGAIAVPSDGTPATLLALMQEMVLGCENHAKETQDQIGRLGIYFRFSVEQGMQRAYLGDTDDTSLMVTRTQTYLGDLDVSTKMDAYIKSLHTPVGLITLERLRHTGGPKAVYKTAPVLATYYIRRQVPWKQLVDGVSIDSSGQTIVILAGMAGCGKTQLVADLVREYKPGPQSHFKHVFFVDGSSEASIESDLVAHVELVSPGTSNIDLNGAKNFFKNPLNGRWLIVFDNVDDIDLDLPSFLPQCDQGTIVVTTRNQALGLLASQKHLYIKLDVMSTDEAIEVLLLCAGRNLPSAEERAWAATIADKLGCLPVALSQAGCYMREATCSGDAYLKLLGSHRPSLMNRPSGNRQKDCAYAAFDISYQRLPAHLQDLVHLLSFFHFANFPEAIIPLAAKALFQDDPFPFSERDIAFGASVQLLKSIFLPEDTWSDLTLPEMGRILQSYSITSITLTPATNLWRIHPLLREWAFDRLSESRRGVFRDAACRIIVCAIEATQLSLYLPPHVETITARLVGSPIHTNDAVSMGKILRIAGQGQLARETMLPIYDTMHREYGPTDLRIATLSLEIAEAWIPFNWQRAEELQIEAVRIRLELLGPLRIETLKARSLLSRTYALRKKLQESQDLLEIVLDGLRVQLGEKHLETLDAENSLAISYIHARRFLEAEILLKKVWEGRRTQLGDGHVDTLGAVHNLAANYYEQGRFSEAEPLQLKVLEGWRDQLGDVHLETLKAMDWLAATYWKQGRHSESESLQIKVLNGRKAQLGEDHIDTLAAMGDLAKIYYTQRRYQEAEPLYFKIFHTRLATESDSSLDLGASAFNLAQNYHNLGRLIEAREVALKAESVYRKALGTEHPRYIVTARLLELINSASSH